jgi:hypothetical protein
LWSFAVNLGSAHNLRTFTDHHLSVEIHYRASAFYLPFWVQGGALAAIPLNKLSEEPGLPRAAVYSARRHVVPKTLSHCWWPILLSRVLRDQRCIRKLSTYLNINASRFCSARRTVRLQETSPGHSMKSGIIGQIYWSRLHCFFRTRSFQSHRTTKRGAPLINLA